MLEYSPVHSSDIGGIDVSDAHSAAYGDTSASIADASPVSVLVGSAEFAPHAAVKPSNVSAMRFIVGKALRRVDHSGAASPASPVPPSGTVASPTGTAASAE